jgi:hypothetical protein
MRAEWGVAGLYAHDIAICILQRLAACIGPNLTVNAGMPLDRGGERGPFRFALAFAGSLKAGRAA